MESQDAKFTAAHDRKDEGQNTKMSEALDPKAELKATNDGKAGDLKDEFQEAKDAKALISDDKYSDASDPKAEFRKAECVATIGGKAMIPDTGDVEVEISEDKGSRASESKVETLESEAVKDETQNAEDSKNEILKAKDSDFSDPISENTKVEILKGEDSSSTSDPEVESVKADISEDKGLGASGLESKVLEDEASDEADSEGDGDSAATAPCIASSDQEAEGSENKASDASEPKAESMATSDEKAVNLEAAMASSDQKDKVSENKSSDASDPKAKSMPATSGEGEAKGDKGEEESVNEFYPVAHIPDVIQFFPEIDEDVSKVTWTRAVKTREELKIALNDDSLMMFDVTVITARLYYHEKTAPKLPVIEDFPRDVGNMSFESWLETFMEASEEGKKHGMKLTFKDVETLEEVLQMLHYRSFYIKFPLWLHADVMAGPGGLMEETFDAELFITECMKYIPQVSLSLGWHTKDIPLDQTAACYTEKMTNDLVNILKANYVKYHVNFYIRAAFVPGSIAVLDSLVERISGSTITVWSSPIDKIDPVELLNLRDAVGHDTVLFNLPPDQAKEFYGMKAEEEDREARPKIFPNSVSGWATTVGIASSAVAALYLYNRY